MRLLSVLVVIVLVAATAFAYGDPLAVPDRVVLAAQTATPLLSEPVTLLLSGSALLGLGAAIRRLAI